MSFLSKIKRILSEKDNDMPTYNGLFIIVDWNDTAREYGMSYDFYKEILFIENQRIVWAEDYTEARVNQLKQRGFFVYDKTEKESIPKEALFARKADLVMGQLQLRKMEVYPEYLY